MSGCFGNHPVDKWMESQLNEYLNGCDDDHHNCKNCEFSGCDDDWIYDDLENVLICPNCGFKIQL